MKFGKIPCHRCPQHSKFFKPDNLTAIIHTCRENWYAEMERVDSVTHEPEDSLAQLNGDELQSFWDKPKHRFFSCPYRREKFVYKIVPLVVSFAALVISGINSDTLKTIVGLNVKEAKPTKLEQPVQVTIKAEPLRIEQPVRVISEASNSTSDPALNNSNESRGREGVGDRPRKTRKTVRSAGQ